MIPSSSVDHSLKLSRPFRILVSGAEGMLGRAFSRQIARYCSDCELMALGQDGWDVRDPSRIAELADWVGSGWIIHCAALVDVEGCAKDPELARQTIVDGTSHVVKVAALSGARILYPQTFLVYDGSKNPITEQTAPQPLSLYASLKLAAEEIVRAQSRQNLVIRMAGFFGGEAKDKNFVGRIIPLVHRQILSGQRTYEVGDRVWQPTYTMDLAFNSLALMRRQKDGIYVMACHGEASFWELTKEISRKLGWAERIEIIRTAARNVAQNELGRRPDRAVIVNERLRSEALDLQRPWKEALTEYLASPYFNSYRL